MAALFFVSPLCVCKGEKKVVGGEEIEKQQPKGVAQTDPFVFPLEQIFNMILTLIRTGGRAVRF